MKDEIEKAIEELAKLSIKDATNSNAALKFTQAALNLANTLATISNISDK